MKGKCVFAVILVLTLLVALTGGMSSPSIATASGQDRPLADSIKDQTSSLEEPAIYVTCDSGTDISDEIQAAVDTLRGLGGGTIYLPEGDFLFTTPVGASSQSMMPGGINVIGQGIDKTILRHTVDHSSFFDINHWGYAGGAFRISGISFYGVPAAVGVTSGGISISNIVDFRIDHCHFERILYNIGVRSRAGYPQSRGVVDHCTFIAADVTSAYGVFDTRVWQEDMQLGSAEATFIEDCYMEGMGHAGASFGGGHYVLRYNQIVDSNGSIDAHGPGFDSSGRGARATEIYGNTVYQNPARYGWTAVGLRAGGGVIFNNTFKNYDHYARFSIDTPGYNATGGVYPTLDQVTDMWLWDNTLIDIANDPNDPDYEDDWAKYPNRITVDGILLYSNEAGRLIQKDRDFHLREPNMVDDGFVYEPYTYPHPLTQELILNATPADRAIHLSWEVNSALQIAGWQLAYQGPTGDQTSPITSIISPTRAFTLTGLTNYAPYTITLNAMVDTTPILTATAYAMPTDIFVYLPLVQKDAASP